LDVEKAALEIIGLYESNAWWELLMKLSMTVSL
jgi:hypothetical protein